MFFKIAVLKNFAIFARKHLWWIVFLINRFNKNTYFEIHLETAASITKYHHSELVMKNVHLHLRSCH